MANTLAIDLNGRRALVTGASRGIGRAIAIGLAKAGASLVVHARKPSEQLERVIEEIQFLGGDVQAWCVDIEDEAQLKYQLTELHTEIDILVLNASIEHREKIDSLSATNVHQQIQSNLVSSISLTQALVPKMRKRAWGRVIALGSIQEIHPNPDLSVYAALKAAQTHFLKTLAVHVAGDGVTINTLAPGAILTDRNRAILSDGDFREKVKTRIPMGKIGSPQDCVGAAVFLASDWSSYITGAWLPVDGGFHAC